VNAAKAADQVVLVLGETREMSGEAASRSTLDLPGRQEELLRAIKATGKPVAVVLMNGRPLALEDVVDDAPALLEAWFPGVQAARRSPTWCSARSTRAASSRHLPAPARPGADLLQPRADRPALRPPAEVRLPPPDIPSCAPLFGSATGSATPPSRSRTCG
jgi:hypothetical protein